MTDALSIILLSDDYRRAQYGLSLALTAASLARSTSILFAGPALFLLTEQGWRDPAIEASRDRYLQRKLASAEELLEFCGELSVPLLACDAAMRLHGVDAGDFTKALGVSVSGLTTVLAQGQPVVV